MRKLLSRPSLIIGITSGAVVALVLGLSQGFSAFESNERSHTPPSPDSGYWSDARVTPASDAQVEMHSATTVDGEIWAVRGFRNEFGEYCAGEVVPGEGYGLGCFPSDDRSGGRPVRIFVGSAQQPGADLTRWTNIWVWGFATPAVKSINVVLTDCSIEELKPDSAGIFLYVEDPKLIESDIWPARVEAIDMTGDVAAEEPAHIDVPDTDAAADAGVKAPAAGKACA